MPPEEGTITLITLACQVAALQASMTWVQIILGIILTAIVGQGILSVRVWRNTNHIKKNDAKEKGG